MDPREPVYPADGVEHVERVDHVDRVEQPIEPARPVQPVQPVAPVQPASSVERHVRSVDYTRPVVTPAQRAERIIYLVLAILEVLLAIRLVLKLLGANPDAGFSALIYGITAPFVALFQGVFGNPSADGNVLDLATVLAMIVYALLAWIIVKVIEATRNRPQVPA